ncbi:MAG: hypothetical protein J5956_01090 [Ruminococcus sp.]|nr:hypothetical protein [Ruminococcus sp.]
MDASIIVSLITGAVTVITVVINAKINSKDFSHKLETQQAVFETKLDTLTAEVREHNNFARRMPVVEEQIKVINHRLEDLEHEKSHKKAD